MPETSGFTGGQNFVQDYTKSYSNWIGILIDPGNECDNPSCNAVRGRFQRSNDLYSSVKISSFLQYFANR